MAFRDQVIELLCQLCQDGGAVACERCSRPVCPKHHGPDRCKVCEDEFEAAQVQRDADVEHLRKLIRSKRHRAPDHVCRYNNRMGGLGFSVLVIPSLVAILLWRDSLMGLLVPGGAFVAFILIWTVVAPIRFRLRNARSRHRQHFLAQRESVVLERGSETRVELADATRTAGQLVEERYQLYHNDRYGHCGPMNDEVFVLEGDQHASSWDQVLPERVVVTGSLVVDGVIDLRMKEPGGFLAVLGDLEASGVDVWTAEGMSSLYVAGTAKIAGCVVLDSGGMLTIDGDLECRALISLGYDEAKIGGAQTGVLVGNNQPATEFLDSAALDEYGEIDGDRVESGELSSREFADMLR